MGPQNTPEPAKISLAVAQTLQCTNPPSDCSHCQMPHTAREGPEGPALRAASRLATGLRTRPGRARWQVALVAIGHEEKESYVGFLSVTVLTDGGHWVVTKRGPRQSAYLMHQSNGQRRNASIGHSRATRIAARGGRRARAYNF